MSIDGKELPSVAAGDVLSIDIDMLSSVDFIIVYSNFFIFYFLFLILFLFLFF